MFKNINELKVLKLFLKLYNFIRIFIYHVNEITEPLNKLLKKKATFDKRLK